MVQKSDIERFQKFFFYYQQIQTPKTQRHKLEELVKEPAMGTFCFDLHSRPHVFFLTPNIFPGTSGFTRIAVPISFVTTPFCLVCDLESLLGNPAAPCQQPG